MDEPTKARPTSAMVIAVLALALSVVGTAAAVPGQLTHKITKPKVKRIAQREIEKAAAGLSVGHASSADSAGAVDGFDANSLIRTASGSTTDAPDADGTATTATIQAPRGGFLTIFATADFTYGPSGTDQVECLLEIDGAAVPATSRVTNVSGDASVDSDCATNATRPISAGLHQVDLEIAQLTNTGVAGAGVSVIYTPFNSSGAGG